MLKTVREEQVGKVTMRLVRLDDDSFKGVIIGGKPILPVEGTDEEVVWRKLRAEVGKASPAYFGYDGACSRFLQLFPQGFQGHQFTSNERDYKVTASEYLIRSVPLADALRGSVEHVDAVAKAFSKTNMLSQFEHARTRDVLKSQDGPAFIVAAAALAGGDTSALKDIERLFRPHGQPSWPAATYLPFLWRPDVCMFLKPEVTKDFADRVGHPFSSLYGSSLAPSVYEALLSLAEEARMNLQSLGPRDMIDIRSFIWVVGAYEQSDADAQRVPG